MAFRSRTLRHFILSFLTFLALFVSLSSNCLAADVDNDIDFGVSDSLVVELTSDNFNERTSALSDTWIIAFTAPWCNHCQQLKPVLEDAAEILAEQHSNVQIANVDCTLHTDLLTKFDIKGYPTLMVKRGETTRRFPGARTITGILNFAEEMSKPSIIKIAKERLSYETLIKMTMKPKEGSAIAPPTAIFFGDDESKEYEHFKQVAFEMQGIIRFIYAPLTKIDDLMLLSKFELLDTDLPAVTVMSWGEAVMPLCAPFSFSQLREFVDAHRMPLIAELAGDTFEELTSGKKPLALIVYQPNLTAHNAYIKSVYSIAKLRRNQFFFATLDGTTFASFAMNYHVFETDLPTIVVIDHPDDFWSVRDFNGDHNDGHVEPDRIADYLDQVQSGKLSKSSLHSMWSPLRYWRMFERYMSDVSYLQLIGGATVLAVVLLLLTCFSLYFFLPNDDESIVRERRIRLIADAANISDSELQQAGLIGHIRRDNDRHAIATTNTNEQLSMAASIEPSNAGSNNFAEDYEQTTADSAGELRRRTGAANE